MGKRKNEQPPGGGGKCHVPKTKRSFREDSSATADDGLDVTGPAQTGDADGKPQPAAGGAEDRGDTTRDSAGSAATNAPRSANGDGEAAAPEPGRAAEHVPGPSPQDGRDAGTGGGGKLPEAAAPGAASQPESPQRANPAADATEEDQPAATTERHEGAGEEPDAETQTPRGTGNIGDSPECGSATPARGEGAAGREIALPADAAGRSTGSGVPDPHREEGVNRSEPGKRRGDADQSQEPPHASAVNAEEKESGAVSETVAGERRKSASEERPRDTSTSDVVKNAAGSRCSPAGSGSAEVSGVCAPESAGAAGTVSPASPRKTPGDADMGREEAGGGETPSPGPSSVPDPAVPAGGNPSGEGEGDGLAEERGTGSAPAVMATPGPAPTGTARPPAAGTGSAAGTEPPDKASSAGEQLRPRPALDGNGLQPPPLQPLPGDAAGRGLHAAAGRSRAEEPPPLAEGNGPDQPPRPRGEEPEGLRPLARSEDATDVVCGLILELSNLNRLAMSAHRGLAALRRPKPRRGRQPGTGPVPPHAGRRWKET